MKNLLACPLEKDLRIVSGWHGLGAGHSSCTVLRGEKLLLQRHCRGNLLSRDRFCKLPSLTFSKVRLTFVLECAQVLLQIVGEEKSGLLPSLFCNYLLFFPAGLAKRLINPDCKPGSFYYHFSSQNF